MFRLNYREKEKEILDTVLESERSAPFNYLQLMLKL